MKLFTILLLSIFLQKGCKAQTQNRIKDVDIIYTAVSRGFQSKIVIENQMVTVISSREKGVKPMANPISDADWKIISDCLQDLKLDQLKTLKAPSQKRYHDGAAVADIKITIQEKEYQSTSFDHGNPPAEIKELVDKINTFAEKKQ
jgi:hypothetical protein